MNLSIEDDSVSQLTKTSLTEKCKICDKPFPIDTLREHFSSCSDFESKSDTESTEDEDERESITDEDRAPESPTNGSANPPVTVDLTSDELSAVSGQNTDSVPEISLEEAIKTTIDHCKENNIENPVEVLKYMQKMVVTGRPLEIENPDEALEGETNFILVDRMNLLPTAFDEIRSIQDLRKTLEVQFYNEVSP